MKNFVTSNTAKAFYDNAMDSIGCVRCNREFARDSKCAVIAQMSKGKSGRSMFAGGTMCERCSTDFRKWWSKAQK